MHGSGTGAGIGLGVLAALIVVFGAMGWAGRLPLNHVIGIRLPVTMRSDQAWADAHRAAGPFLVLTGVVGAVGSVAALLAADEDLSTVVPTTLIGLLFFLAIAVVVAVRAARNTPEGRRGELV